MTIPVKRRASLSEQALVNVSTVFIYGSKCRFAVAHAAFFCPKAGTNTSSQKASNDVDVVFSAVRRS